MRWKGRVAKLVARDLRNVANRSDTKDIRIWLRAPHLETGSDEEPLAVLRLVATIGAFFVSLYLILDLAIRSSVSLEMHFLLLAGAIGFLLFTWMPIFRRVWQLWAFSYCVFIMGMFIPISAITHDPVSRMLVIMLCPFATASFVSWGPRWQLAMTVVALVGFGAAQLFVPFNDGYNAYRWSGVLAALVLAQVTAIFIDQYRRRIRGQVEALERAALFRERQVATMAHDIRNPVSALSGYVELLEDPTTSAADRDRMIARIGSTAWNTNLVIGNSLDLYRLEEDGRVKIQQIDTDPNPVIADVAEDCAVQARRMGIVLRSELAPLPRVAIDSQRLARIVRNLAAVPIGARCGSEVSLTASVCGDRVAIEVFAPGAAIMPADLDHMIADPRSTGRPLNAGKSGLFLARAMTEAAGGKLSVEASQPAGIRLRAEIPSVAVRPIQ
jgi:signal transduction histidine kinase